MDNRLRTFNQWIEHVEQLEIKNQNQEFLIAQLRNTIDHLVDMNRDAINAEIINIYNDVNRPGSTMINAIKRARELTGLGLKESKEYVESLIASL